MIDEILKIALIGLIRAYRFFLSPFFGNQCRFHPTCSAYALEAVELHGGFWGGWLALRRLGRCHPLHDGGIDLVPIRAKDAKEDVRQREGLG